MPAQKPPSRMRRAVSSLQQIEERLRRTLGLVGDIGTKFSPNAIPIVIASDATEVGNNIFRGRAFAGSHISTIAVAGGVVFKFPNACIVDQISMYFSVAGSDYSLSLAPADAGNDPLVTTTLFASWTELNDANNSRAPIFASNPAAMVAIGNTIERGLTGAVNNVKTVICCPFHVTAGTRLCLFTATAGGWGTAFVNIRGRLV